MKDLNRRSPLLTLLILTILALIFFFGVLFQNKTFHYGDLSSYFYPLRSFFFNQVKSGEMPLWNPFDGTGVPTLANPQTGAFYPLNVLYLVMPSLRAFNVSIVLHFLIAALGMVLLLRGFRLRWPAVLAGAVSFAFGGVVLSLHSMLDYFEAAVWLPAFLHFVLGCLWRRPTWRGVAGGAVTYALMLINSVQYALLAAMVCALATIIALAIRRPDFPAKRKAWAVTAVLCIGLLGLTLSAVQTVPTVLGLQEMGRGEPLSLKEATRVSMQPAGLANLLVPGLLYDLDGTVAPARRPLVSGDRQTWILELYPGVFALLFGFWGLAIAPLRHRLLWGGLIVISIPLALGKSLPFYSWVYHTIPFFDHFRYPEKFLLFFALGLSVLAAFGLNALASDERKHHRLAAVVLVWIAPVAALALWQLLDVRSFVTAMLCLLFNIDLTQLVGEAVSQVSEQVAPLLWRFRLTAILMTLCGLLIWLARRRPQARKTVVLLVCVLCVVDLFVANRPATPMIDASLLTTPPEIAQYMPAGFNEPRLASVQDWRVHHQPEVTTLREVAHARTWLHKEELVPDYGMLYGLGTIHPISVLAGKRQQWIEKRMRRLTGEERLPLFDLFNARYLLSIYPVNREGVEKIADIERNGQTLYENRNAFGAAYLRRKMVLADSSEQAWGRIIDGQIDPRETVVWQRNDAAEKEDRGNAGGEGGAALEFVSPHAFNLSVQTDAPAYAVTGIAYHPHWRCRDENGRVTKRIANGLFLSFPVVASTQITCHYADHDFRTGGLIGSIGLLILAVVVVVGVLGDRRKQDIAGGADR